MTISMSIEGNTLRIVSTAGKKIDKWDSISLPPELVREGLITETSQMANIVKQTITERKLSAKNVRWALPGIGTSSQIMTLPQVGKAGLENTVQREARRVLSVSPETSYLFWQLLPGSSPQQVYAVAIPKDLMQALIQTCQMAGVTVGSIDLRPLALARAINQKDAIIAHGEINSVETVVMIDSVPSLMRGIWVREKGLDAGRATALLLQQLASTIEYYNDMNRSNPLPTTIPIYLTGEAALNPELTQRVSTLSGRTVAAPEPPVSYPPHFPLPLYMTNIGLILKS